MSKSNLSVKIDSKLYEAIGVLKYKKKTTIREIVEEALRDYIEKNKEFLGDAK